MGTPTHKHTDLYTHIHTKTQTPFPSYRQPGGVRFGELLTISVSLAHFTLPHPPYPSQLFQPLLPALTSSRKFPGWQVCPHRCILRECGDMWFATEGDTFVCKNSHIGSLWHVCMCVCVYAHVCARSQEDREIYNLNLASPEDESKAKFRFKSHDHGQEGFPCLT